jgi:hypothetical protein
MELELPENFPLDKPLKKGVEETLLVKATPTEDGSRKLMIDSIDGVPMNSPGKANAPYDEGSPEEEAEETPEEEAEEQEGGDNEGGEEEQNTPPADMPDQADQGGSPTPGQGFAKAVMRGP